MARSTAPPPARRAAACSSPGRWISLLALVLLVFLVISVLCQMATTRNSAWMGRTTATTEGFTLAPKRTAEIIYVYMDGCAHCKQFDPTWAAFSSKYKQPLEDAGLSLRKVKNDDGAAKDLGVRGFPSVVLVSKTNDFPQKTYDGQRTVPDLAAFVHDTFPAFTP